MDGKYITFKRSDWEQFAFEGMGEDGIHSGGTAGIPINDLVERVVDDAVVIRRQDVFAPPALDAYANSIMSAVLLLEAGTPLDEAEVRRLKGIADYFHEQAALSWQTDRKIPD